MLEIKPNTIFVSIASYRDDVCNSTLRSLFEMAEDPDRVFVGICQQNKEDEDGECNKGFENDTNVRVIRIPYYEAKGPTYARYLCSTLWNGEEYFMQIDSHSKFVKNWDKLCIDMIQEIKDKGLSEKPVLSHYPKGIEYYDGYEKNNNNLVPRICKSFFNNRGMLSFLGAQEMDTKGEPYRTPYVSGGMVFGESKFLNDLPYDPNLPFLFVGEEILHSIRFFTHGWDSYTPSQNIVFHEYTRAEKPKIWTDNKTYSDQDAFDKVKLYIKFLDEEKRKLPEDVKFNMDKYGLGRVRTLEDYYNYAGIDVQNQVVRTNFCNPDNKATEDDILNSNEKNHKPAEHFCGSGSCNLEPFQNLFPYLSGKFDHIKEDKSGIHLIIVAFILVILTIITAMLIPT